MNDDSLIGGITAILIVAGVFIFFIILFIAMWAQNKEEVKKEEASFDIINKNEAYYKKVSQKAERLVEIEKQRKDAVCRHYATIEFQCDVNKKANELDGEKRPTDFTCVEKIINGEQKSYYSF